MKKIILHYLPLFFLLSLTISAQYGEREDAVWARMTDQEITLDGVLDEAAWANAEEITVNYGEPGRLPFSGYEIDGGGGQGEVTDPTTATVKFLVTQDNNLYIAFDVQDAIVGGSATWPKWEGILMSIKSRTTEDYLNGNPSTPWEYFYALFYENSPIEYGVGTPPVFRGKFDNEIFDTIAAVPSAFDGYWQTDGITNDSLADNGWVAELKIGLDTLGIDVTQPGGDIIELNFSIWDHDYTKGDPLASYTTRTWLQNPWNSQDNPERIYANPNVTTETASLPMIEPDLIFKSGAGVDDPTIDGVLDEPVWDGAYLFDLAWENIEVRKTYGGIGPYRSGRFQPELDLDDDGNVDPKAVILDPVVAHIYGFFKDNYLYLGGVVEDKVVQGVRDSEYDMMDALTFRIGERDTLDPNVHRLIFREMGVFFDTLGNVDTLKHLSTLLKESGSEFGVSLLGNTVVNDQSALDSGYAVEMKIDLSYFGYPYEDNAIFFGVMVQDGDKSETDPLSGYGTRSWYFGESGNWAVAWSAMDPSQVIVGVDDNASLIPEKFQLLGNYPNPFNPATKIKFATPVAGAAKINIYNVIGQLVTAINVADINAGVNEVNFNAGSLASGVYLYNISLQDKSSNQLLKSSTGKMILMK